MKIKFFYLLIIIFLSPASAFAIQAHGGSEGIIVHQLGHIFFLLSLCALVYWINEKWFLNGKSKRYFQIFGILLILWNLDVVIMHFLDEQLEIINISRNGFQYLISADSGSKLLPVIYYIGKMDHLLCVPALLFLYLGLKSMESERGERN